MKQLTRAIAATFIALSLSGCQDHEKTVKTFLPGHIDAFARDFINSVLQRDMPQVLGKLDITLKSEEISNDIQAVFDYLKQDKFVSLAPTSAYVFQTSENCTYNLTYRIQYAEACQLAGLAILEEPAATTVTSIHVIDLPDSPAVPDKPALEDKGTSHSVLWGVTVAYLLLLIIQFIVCLKAPIRKRGRHTNVCIAKQGCKT